MAKMENGSLYDVRDFFLLLLYAKLYQETMEGLQAGPSGLHDKEQESGCKKMRAGPSGLHDKEQSKDQKKPQAGPSGLRDKKQTNDQPDKTVKLIADALVEDSIFADKALAAFDEGQEKDEGKFAA